MSEVYKYIPYVDFRSAGEDWRYYDFDTECRWREEFRNSKDPYSWAANKVAEQSIIDEHSQECMEWEQIRPLLQRYRRVKYGDTIHDRKRTIYDRVLAAGWKNELNFMVRENIMHMLMDDIKVESACKSALTEEELINLDPHLDRIMAKVFELNLEQKRYHLLDEYIQTIEDILTSYSIFLPANSLVIGMADVILHPITQSYLANPNPKSEAYLSKMMPVIAADIKVSLNNQVYDLIRANTPPGYAFNRDIALNLATTIFYCSLCGGDGFSISPADPIRYPRIINHNCAFYHLPDFSCDGAGDSKEIDIDICGQITGCTSWNRFKVLKMNKEDFKALAEIVIMCGLDPQTATGDDMDALDPIFECVSCNSPELGRTTMRWSLVPRHRKQWNHCNSKTPPDIVLLEEEEAEAVRIRMDEEESRRMAHNMYRDLICARCKTRGSSGHLRYHCKTTSFVEQVSKSWDP
ncbi:hypothetical protein JR316_0003142 [Psilocybe cubensis]|uniref:Uncharacterized protein n=2 Tax=Psilocybe cubensis TaxID=181762 RepID=A0A8H7XZV7_PSICU|nr:hypothetical protein JR316_0003142 [Psilocybe cubensis]KAH9483672.1 hypothetical protein JR316_0003142 [Psilocybe cubensis]